MNNLECFFFPRSQKVVTNMGYRMFFIQCNLLTYNTIFSYRCDNQIHMKTSVREWCHITISFKPWKEILWLISLRHTNTLCSSGKGNFSAVCKFHTLQLLNYDCEAHFTKGLVSCASSAWLLVFGLESVPDLWTIRITGCALQQKMFCSNDTDYSNPFDEWIHTGSIHW